MPAQAKNGKALLIVESPSKVKTISGYLGEDYLVDSSMGHIRDLPQPSELPENLKKGPYGKFAVDVEDAGGKRHPCGLLRKAQSDPQA